MPYKRKYKYKKRGYGKYRTHKYWTGGQYSMTRAPQILKTPQKTKVGLAQIPTTVGHLTSKAGYGSVRSPFPPQLYTTFSYSETFTLSQVTVDVPIFYKFRANGLYDPNQSGVGQQPRYYDTLLGDNDSNAPYRNYRVHGSSIKVTCWPIQGNANLSNALIYVAPQRATVTDPSSVDEFAERPYAKTLPVTTTASYKPRVLKHFCRIKTHLGHKDLNDVDSTASAYNALPNEEVYWVVGLCNVQAGGQAQQTFQVSITYYVQLYTLVDVIDS